MHLKSPWKCKNAHVVLWPRTQAQRRGDKERDWETDAVSLQAVAGWASSTLGKKSIRTGSAALCPWQLHLTVFVLHRRRAPTPPPKPSFSTGDVWCPAYQPSFTTNKRGTTGETSWNPHDELSVEPSTRLSEQPAAQMLFQPDLIIANTHRLLYRVCVCVCVAGRTDTQIFRTEESFYW